MSTYPSDSKSSRRLCSVINTPKKVRIRAIIGNLTSHTVFYVAYQFRDECCNLHNARSLSNSCSPCTRFTINQRKEQFDVCNEVAQVIRLLSPKYMLNWLKSLNTRFLQRTIIYGNICSTPIKLI